ncbi:MAG: amidohydrolase family protein [Bacteroidales bacterium]|nr:amidohydrolase family protein [Bacteroidales bacterium]
MNSIVKGNLVDIHNRNVYPAELHISNDRIDSIVKVEECFDRYIVPGFIDAHIHIESSLLTPQNFSKIVCCHGTIAYRIGILMK